jgi:hypothetical protein
MICLAQKKENLMRNDEGTKTDRELLEEGVAAAAAILHGPAWCGQFKTPVQTNAEHSRLEQWLDKAVKRLNEPAPAREIPLFQGGEQDDGWDEKPLLAALSHASLVASGSRRCISQTRDLRSTIVALYKELMQWRPLGSPPGGRESES